MPALKIKTEKKTKSAKSRCFNCKHHQIKCEPSIENKNICKYCFKKNLNETDCLKVAPKYYPNAIKNLNKLLNETKLKNLELEKQISTLKRNHQLFKKNIENLNTILNFQ